MPNARRMIARWLVFAAFAFFVFFSIRGGSGETVLGQTKEQDSYSKLNREKTVRLGEQLFRESRFSTTEGDLPASCSNCHMLDEDPQGLRAFADFFNRSWVSSRMQDIRRLHPRNSPTIFDVGEMPSLHYDGEFATLEDLVKGTLGGRPMGWLPGEQDKAFEQGRQLVLNSYRTEFSGAFGVDPGRIDAGRAMDLVAKAIAEFCRTFKTPRDSAYDRFMAANGLEQKPSLDMLSNQTLKLTPEFDRRALEGMKIFFNTERGNCVACHAPPLFTDNSFHNKGTSQREYDRIHGEGTFSALSIPNALDAKRPAQKFREAPSSYKPGDVDLGHWNFVDLKTSTMRRSGESNDQFLERMIATFKTPTLRNLKYTFPYFHDGSINTLEDTLSEMVRLSELARAGRLRSADVEFAKVRLNQTDIPPLLAFLDSLNDELKKMKRPGARE